MVTCSPPYPILRVLDSKTACSSSIKRLATSFSGPPAPKKIQFFLKKCKKWCFFALKGCFLALGGHLQPPLPYFEGDGVRETRVLSIRSLVTSFFGPASTKKLQFFLKKMQKMVFFCPEMVFSGPGWSPAPPPPVLRVLDSKTACVSSIKSLVTRFSVPPATKKLQLFLKKMQKMVFFCPEMVFSGPGWSPAAPPTLY